MDSGRHSSGVVDKDEVVMTCRCVAPATRLLACLRAACNPLPPLRKAPGCGQGRVNACGLLPRALLALAESLAALPTHRTSPLQGVCCRQRLYSDRPRHALPRCVGGYLSAARRWLGVPQPATAAAAAAASRHRRCEAPSACRLCPCPSASHVPPNPLSLAPASPIPWLQSRPRLAGAAASTSSGLPSRTRALSG